MITIRKTPCPDTDIEVNGVSEGSVVAGATVDIQLSDSLGVVTPISVTQTGNDFAVVLPDAPPSVTRSTATLMKTGQTTSYRTGDDGDIQPGRATDFYTLDAAPVHNDGSPTLNTTTNRFTDTLGGQTYANDIVLDWSTWDGSTLLGVAVNTTKTGYRSIQDFGRATNTWDQAVDDSYNFSIGVFQDWRMMNNMEGNSFNDVNTTLWGNTLFNSGNNSNVVWSNNTYPLNTSSAFRFVSAGQISNISKTTDLSTYYFFTVRTFSLSTSNVLS